jgi:hypothetical protein
MTRHKMDPLHVLRTPATRPDLHALVDRLPDNELNEAARYLTGLATADPVLRALLLAPPEDEEMEPEELEAIKAGRQAYERGEYVADEDLARELGECP